ncbi:MAG: hypothetical protein M1812_001219 [Candelaria pacifica]|nr:MAG: hypothetical protein M1812_001219 [Candelaria pacifica]
MPRHKWTKYELHTLLCFLAKQEHTESEIHLSTEFNKALSSMDYAGDIDKKEIRAKVLSLLKERPAFAKMLLRNKIPKLTRTLRLSFERALNFTGDIGEEKPSRKNDAITDTAWGEDQQKTSAGDGAAQGWGDNAGNDGTTDTNNGGWGGEIINGDANTADDTSWGGAPSQPNGGNNHTDTQRGVKPTENGLFIAQDSIWGGEAVKMTNRPSPSPTDSQFPMEAETVNLDEQIQSIFDAHRRTTPAPLVIQPQTTKLAMLAWHPDSPALKGPLSAIRDQGSGSLTDKTPGNGLPHTENADMDQADAEADYATEETDQLLWGGWGGA